MIDDGKLCDTVLALVNAGKKLPDTMDGSDPYEFACNDFMVKFRNNGYDDYDWTRAEQAYKASDEFKIITAQLFSDLLKRQGAVWHEKVYTEEEKRIYGIWKRTGARLWKSFSRILAMGGNIMDNLPTDDEVIQIGMKYGFQANELLLPIEEGGQKRAIQSFVAEYRIAKAKGYDFKYKMGVENKEIVWLEAR